MSLKPNEIKIGIMVICCLIGFVFITLRVGNFNFYKKGYNIYIEMKDINGLEPNSPVKLNGIDVGEIKDATIKYGPDGTKIILDAWLKEGTQVSPQAKITIKTMGLMGEKYISIQQNEVVSPVLARTVMRGDGGADIDNMLAQADLLVTDFRGLTNDLRSVAHNVDTILVDNRENLHDILVYLEGFGKNFEEFSLDLKKNPWKLLFKSSK